MTPSRLQYLLDKYLNETATPAEMEEYDRWYYQQQEQETPAFTQDETTEIYKVIAAGIRERRVYRTRWVAAAAILLAAGCLWLFRPRPADIQVVASAATTAEPDSVVIVNTTTAKKYVQLPDGSLATVYRNAELRYAASFGKDNRVIRLRGKSFFDVVKNTALPFTVHTHDVTTTALGTSFTVAGAGREVNIWLHTGKVMVKAKSKVHYLTPGQQLTCNILTGSIRLVQPDSINKHITDKMPLMAWGSLQGFAATFDQVPLAAVLDSIGKGYHVNIHTTPADFNDIVFSGVVRNTDSLAQVLHRIAMLHDLKITSTHTGYRIERNH